MKRKVECQDDPIEKAVVKKPNPEVQTDSLPNELRDSCVICMYGVPPEFKKIKPTWSSILESVLYSLKCLHPEQEFFSLRNDIYIFIDEHWDYLETQKDRDTPWRQTVKMTLSRYGESFENGYEKVKKRGYWKIRDHVNPYRIPIFTMFEKKKGIIKCRFSAENYRAMYEERKEFLKSIPSAQVIGNSEMPNNNYPPVHSRPMPISYGHHHKSLENYPVTEPPKYYPTVYSIPMFNSYSDYPEHKGRMPPIGRGMPPEDHYMKNDYYLRDRVMKASDEYQISSILSKFDPSKVTTSNFPKEVKMPKILHHEMESSKVLPHPKGSLSSIL